MICLYRVFPLSLSENTSSMEQSSAEAIISNSLIVKLSLLSLFERFCRDCPVAIAKSPMDNPFLFKIVRIFSLADISTPFTSHEIVNEIVFSVNK